MTTKRKRWPNNAEWARLDSIAAASKIREELRPVLTNINGMTTAEIVTRVALALEKAQTIEVKLAMAKQGEL